MLNRAVLVVRPKKPYIDWAVGLDDSGLVPDPDDDVTAYLIPEYEDDVEAEEILALVYSEIFERQLDEWHTLEADWPKNRTLAMFKEWFHIELHSVVEDLCAEPLIDDEDDV